jgi:1-acyl-sn-glycerol-3-phosphate acyltransferase
MIKRTDPGDSEMGEASLATRLLEIVRALALELAPERSRMRITLDTDLDRELGFDSLSRVELLLRLERGLNVRIPEQAFTAAETPRDLLRAVLATDAAMPTERLHTEVEPVVLGATEAIPKEVDTLQEVLSWRADREPDRTHVLLYETDAETPLNLSFGDLQAGARRIAAGLMHEGFEPGQAASIMLPTGREYLESFFGVMLAGGIPVPIYPPARPSQLEDHLRRHAKILSNASARFLITVPEGQSVGRLLKRQVDPLRAVETPAALAGLPGNYSPVAVSPDDIALLQYTSGSTGQPKGVILTHANLLANIRAMGEWVRASSDDVFVSWLPLYHDMGLIGAWLGSLYFAMLSVLMPPTAFLTRPWRWLWAIHEHGGTISAAPNFAYELCLSKIPDSEIEGLDLGRLRLLFNGAEPVSPQTVRRFSRRFADYGLNPTALSPVYGLAESAVGLAFPPLERGPIVDRIQRRPFERTGRAVAAEEGEETLEFVACGQPLRGYEIRIVDDGGRELSDAEEGHLEFRGPSATRGYMGNPEATAKLFDGEWLDSGDLAYVREGDVYLTSRVKDVIIRAGRNIYPYELEEAVGDLPEVRKGCVAVFGSAGDDSDIEQLIVVAESRLEDGLMLEDLRHRIEVLSTDILGVTPDDVVVVPPRTVLKTSSGKIRRAGCRELYERGEIGRGPRSTWWQIARLWLTGLRTQGRRGFRALGDMGYAGFMYVAFGLTLPFALLALALLPEGRARWTALGSLARVLLRVGRIPLVVNGLENLPDSRCIVVANHASYLDGLLLVAILPLPVSFVVKAELKRQRFANWFLNRIGVQFVERFDIQQGTEDARRLTRQAADGAPLMFFPEGTFTRSPGLLGFHMGAFVTAAANQLPVVPITIRGSRSVLRSDDWFPRRGPVAIVIGQAVEERGEDWNSALVLRDRARSEILRHLGEQDLALERGTG